MAAAVQLGRTARAVAATTCAASQARGGRGTAPPWTRLTPKLEQLEPGIARVLAHNPSAFTYYGTQTYLVGNGEVAVIDPGPDLPEHLDALEQAIGGRPVAAIMCTHTHRDHSPAARPLAERDRRADHRLRAARAGDGRAARRRVVRRRLCRPTACSRTARRSRSTASRSIAVATPGHTSNHLCFAYRGALFSGDHVMGWSTTVVVPPDGDMAAYMASLDKLRQRDDRDLLSGARAAGDQPAAICAAPDRPPDAAREADPAAASASKPRDDPRHRRQRLSRASIRGWSPRPAGRCSRICWTLSGAGSFNSDGELWTAA